MKLRIGFKILAGYAVAIALFAIVSSVAYSKARVMIQTEIWVEHTFEVLNTIEHVLSLVQEAETGQRGYLITGEDRYLEPYIMANENLSPTIEKLRKLTKDNLDQQQRWDELAELVKQKQAELAETIELRRNGGLDAALPVVVSDRGKTVMDDIRKLLGDAEADEEALLTVRRDQAAAAYRVLVISIAGGTVAGAILATILGIGITRSITSRTGRTLKMIQEMSRGNLQNSLQMKADDEIGEIAKAMDHLAESLRDITAAAEGIAQGNLSSEVSPRSNEDTLGLSLQKMIFSLREITAAADEIAQGNLTSEVTPRSNEDTLGLALQKMIVSLRSQIQEILDGAGTIASSVSELSASSSQLASSAAENSTSLSETTATVEEVRQTAELANTKAEQMAEDSHRIRETSKQGRDATEETVSSMNKIQTQMSTIAETIISLSEQSQAIGQIIATVDSLSEQSNVLAVNASIEAAKAGEQGKGFSVVAQEVKSLAEQSKQATTQVRSILNEIQKATSTAVMATEQGNKVVEKGTDTAITAGQAIVNLTSSMDQTSDAAIQIAAASQQQRVGMDQITAAMESVSEASQQNATSARQLETAVEALKNLGERLNSIVGSYKLKE